MNNSSKFFCNKECEYYPCHDGIEEINCLFCYCPLYPIEKCKGNFTYIEIEGRLVKDCSKCIFPHIPENYNKIIDMLKSKGDVK